MLEGRPTSKRQKRWTRAQLPGGSISRLAATNSGVAAKRDEDKDLDRIEVVDLTNSLEQLCAGHDRRILALFSDGNCAQHVEPPIINGIHLLGLETSFFKSHDDQPLQAVADAAILEEIKRVGGVPVPGF